MTGALLYTVGILAFLVAISISIGLHELGHLVPAKRFGVKVTRYMIGFGPTIASKRIGETEYGIKALPLGGYIAMPGMYPPLAATKERIEGGAPQTDAATAAAGDQDPPVRRRGLLGRLTRPFAESMEDARELSNEELAPGEEHRAFYSLSVPKRLVVMFGGPFVNLVLGIALLAISLLGIGLPGPTTTVATVVECAVPAAEAQQRSAADRERCLPGDEPAPAWEAGIEPGDEITAIAGTRVETWEEMSAVIRKQAGRTVPVVIVRDGAEQTLEVPIIASERPKLDADGNPVVVDGRLETVSVGFLGVSPTEAYRPIPASEFPGQAATAVGETFRALVRLPANLVEVGRTAFTDAPRDEEGPIGMVGVGRIAGEIASTDSVEFSDGSRIEFSGIDKVQLGLGLLSSLNLFLFAFNMVPLLPLDGGHIAVALWEGLRRRIAVVRGRGRCGPVDTAALLPLTYAVVAAFLTMTLLLLYVDIVKPVSLQGIFGG